MSNVIYEYTLDQAIADGELVELFSNEKQVTSKTPPAFLAHAKDDRAVVPDNSKAFYEALQMQKVPAKYLELPSGGHGLSQIFLKIAKEEKRSFGAKLFAHKQQRHKW